MAFGSPLKALVVVMNVTVRLKAPPKDPKEVFDYLVDSCLVETRGAEIHFPGRGRRSNALPP